VVWLSARWKLWIMIAPAAIVFSVFIVYPVGYSLWYSFTNFVGFGTPHFVGIKNYVTLEQDPIFWSSLHNTLIILVLSIVVLIPGAFLLAVMLRRKIPGAPALRALVFAPAIMAPILVGLIWIFILDPKLGLINTMLGLFGVTHPPTWIGGDTLTPYSVSLVFIWSSIGFAMTIFFAGLQGLPADVLEASAIDGATNFQQLRYIVVPMLRETFAIVTVLMITNVFKIFELVYELTDGGPVHRSEVLVSYMYFITFTLQQYGKGMALAVFITVLGAIISVCYLLLLRGRRRA
jgi:raffinose/stachyose/melibiose transport system permease protein